MTNQIYHDKFIHYCIINDKRRIKQLMAKKPIDYRYYLKGIKICIAIRHNKLVKLLYSRKGGISKMGTGLIGNLIKVCHLYENYIIASWLITEYKEFELKQEQNNSC